MIKITISTDDDACATEDRVEIPRILEDIAEAIRSRGPQNEPIFDINGNTVGRVEVTS